MKQLTIREMQIVKGGDGEKVEDDVTDYVGGGSVNPSGYASAEQE
jgi:hypothetical protein